MTNRIDFHYDEKNDIVVATPHWHLKTEADVSAWSRDYQKYFARFGGRKVDVVFDLQHFTVDPRIGTAWGEARSHMINSYTRYSYRVSTQGSTGLFAFTSGVRYSASSATAPSVEAAIEQILRHRREEG